MASNKQIGMPISNPLWCTLEKWCYGRSWSLAKFNPNADIDVVCNDEPGPPSNYPVYWGTFRTKDLEQEMKCLYFFVNVPRRIDFPPVS